MVNVTEAFSYNMEEKMSLINKAKDRARRNGQSFSKLVVEALESYLGEEQKGKKVEALCIPILRELPNTESEVNNNTQTRIYSFMEPPMEELYREVHSLELENARDFMKRTGILHSVAKTRVRRLVRDG